MNAFVDDSGQAETTVPKSGIGTCLHAFDQSSQSVKKKILTAQAHAGIFGKEFKGQKIRRHERGRKENEAEKRNEPTVKPSSMTDNLVGQKELSEESHISPTNFAESQDKFTPTKPPPLVGVGRS